MKPITYKPNPDCEGGMEVHRYGKYISVKEYNELKSEIKNLRKAMDLIIKGYENGSVDGFMRSINFAKEVKK